MPQDIELIIKRLKEAIENSGLSYVELEKKTGISKSALQRYATGSTKKIPVDVIQAIAEAVNVSSAWIMGWDDEPEDTKMIETAKVALFGGKNEVTDEMWEEVVNFAKFIEAREAQKNNKD